MPLGKSNELIAQLQPFVPNPTTGLRFFTVYGPWGGLIWPYSFLQKQ